MDFANRGNRLGIGGMKTKFLNGMGITHEGKLIDISHTHKLMPSSSQSNVHPAIILEKASRIRTDKGYNNNVGFASL
jgi:hypothetical protein